jgi:hypothetical protein
MISQICSSNCLQKNLMNIFFLLNTYICVYPLKRLELKGQRSKKNYFKNLKKMEQPS